MARKRNRGSSRPATPEPQVQPRHLLGTMFDATRLLERTLSTGTSVRLRVEELADGRVMVHEAQRRRGDGDWSRWPEVEGIREGAELRLDLCRDVTGEGRTGVGAAHD